jgi:hypothetical protein
MITDICHFTAASSVIMKEFSKAAYTHINRFQHAAGDLWNKFAKNVTPSAFGSQLMWGLSEVLLRFPNFLNLYNQ